MRSEGEDVVAVRQEILDLLRLQMDALDSPHGLTDSQLRECYARQIRVQELRDRLQTNSIPEREARSILSEVPTAAASHTPVEPATMTSFDHAA